VLGTLIDRKLIKIAGRKQVVGRPFMYATTRDFLDRFGLRDLSELPRIEDMADALGFEPPALQETGGDLSLPFDGEPGAAGDPPSGGS
jgi:segregation and condensation protein B